MGNNETKGMLSLSIGINLLLLLALCIATASLVAERAKLNTVSVTVQNEYLAGDIVQALEGAGLNVWMDSGYPVEGGKYYIIRSNDRPDTRN